MERSEYSKFMDAEINRQRKRCPGLENIEYRALAEKKWIKKHPQPQYLDSSIENPRPTSGGSYIFDFIDKSKMENRNNA